MRKNLNFGEKDNIFSTFSQNESKDFSRKLRIFWEKLNFLHIFQENKEFWRKTKFLHIFPSAKLYCGQWLRRHSVLVMICVVNNSYFQLLKYTILKPQIFEHFELWTFVTSIFSNFDLFQLRTFPTSNFSTLTLLKSSPSQLAACWIWIWRPY